MEGVDIVILHYHTSSISPRRIPDRLRFESQPSRSHIELSSRRRSGKCRGDVEERGYMYTLPIALRTHEEVERMIRCERGDELTTIKYCYVQDNRAQMERIQSIHAR